MLAQTLDLSVGRRVH